ncbi:MAG: multicopper oxidase domain-containing protein [Alphaproteobacteria bacterium]|nr:multicopper oxidase domain-containing protein [Alphaproteobacteria bacterium]
MKAITQNGSFILMGAAAMALGFAAPAAAEVNVQCPDWPTDFDATEPGVGIKSSYKCLHFTASDGFAKMGDDSRLYMFGFTDHTDDTFKVDGEPATGGGKAKNTIEYTDADGNTVVENGLLRANSSSPTIALDEGDRLFLTLTNPGMIVRPDLFDGHTVHYHGFPNASSIFDGVPDASIAINEGASLTYFYNNVRPGTYMYHCHFEATEHMQMGMLGNLYVRPAQNRLPDGTMLGDYLHSNPDAGAAYDDATVGDKYVYNDQDGSTRYDVEYPIQISSFDGNFHTASETVQPLPFAEMRDNYAMLNGRGYPDTVIPADGDPANEIDNGNGDFTQKISSLIQANAGQKILLRISNLNVTNYYTLAVMGLKMKIVGKGSRLLRGRGDTDPANHDLYYETASVTLGGGESVDAIIDTTGVAPGTYLLYTTNLNFLSNNQEDLGGMMTEIVVN